MRKNPLFSITAVGSLALSIGALTMAFSIVNAFVFKPLPIRDPRSSVYFMQSSWSYPDFKDLHGAPRRRRAHRLSHCDDERRRQARHVDPVGLPRDRQLLRVARRHACRGRFFTPAEDVAPGASPYAVISFDAWQRRFGGRPDAIGSTRRDQRPAVHDPRRRAARFPRHRNVLPPGDLGADDDAGGDRGGQHVAAATASHQNVMALARLAPGLSRKRERGAHPHGRHAVEQRSIRATAP